MGLKLRDDSGTVDKKPKLKPELDIETGDIIETGDTIDTAPIKISTNVDYKSPVKKNGPDVFTFIKWIVIAVIVIGAISFVKNRINPKVTDLTPYINMEADEVAKKLDLKFSSDDNMASRIHQYSNDVVTVKGDGDIGVVYLNNVYAGLHLDSKSYSLYNLKIGDPAYSMEDDMSYEFDESMCVLDDMAGGSSTAYFYYSYSSSDCFVIIVNENSNRIAAMTYFKDYDKITETLESIE